MSRSVSSDFPRLHSALVTNHSLGNYGPRVGHAAFSLDGNGATAWSKGLTPIYQGDNLLLGPVIPWSSTTYTQVFHRGSRVVTEAILMPSAWTLSRIEAVIFITTVVLAASAGTWLAVGAG
jgi:hypothetical protein